MGNTDSVLYGSKVSVDGRELISKLRGLGIMTQKSISTPGTKTEIYRRIESKNRESTRLETYTTTYVNSETGKKRVVKKGKKVCDIYDVPFHTGALMSSPRFSGSVISQNKNSESIANGYIDDSGIIYDPIASSPNYPEFHYASRAGFYPMYDIKRDIAKGSENSEVLQIIKEVLTYKLRKELNNG